MCCLTLKYFPHVKRNQNLKSDKIIIINTVHMFLYCSLLSFLHVFARCFLSVCLYVCVLHFVCFIIVLFCLDF